MQFLRCCYGTAPDWRQSELKANVVPVTMFIYQLRESLPEDGGRSESMSPPLEKGATSFSKFVDWLDWQVFLWQHRCNKCVIAPVHIRRTQHSVYQLRLKVTYSIATWFLGVVGVSTFDEPHIGNPSTLFAIASVTLDPEKKGYGGWKMNFKVNFEYFSYEIGNTQVGIVIYRVKLFRDWVKQYSFQLTGQCNH